MAVVEVCREVAAGQQRVWDTVTDWPAHARWIPLTTVRTDPGEPRVGWSFAGRTGVGPLRFTDSMILTDWDPPHRFRVVKTGRVLAGWAVVTVEPAGPDCSTLRWREEIVPRPVALGRRLAPLADRATRWIFVRTVDGVVADATRSAA